jgi:DNA-binding response OmpR family regulator
MDDRVVFVPEEGLAIWNGREVELTPQEAQLFGLLVRMQPHVTSTMRLAAMIWPAQLPVMPENHVRVVACRIRKKLAGFPISLVARKGYGYRLAGKVEIVRPE